MQADANTLKSAGNAVLERQQANPDRLARDFQGFVSDVEGLLENAQKISSEGVSLARAKLEEKVEQAKFKLDVALAAAAEEASRALVVTEGYVRRRPLKALGIAAAAGAVVALLLARR
jgi:ElaB/YqjD/DUF883 family membrane-anchored ribosome-binding protein